MRRDSFISQLSTDLSPTGISDMLREPSVLHHPLHIQILDPDGLVFAYEGCREVMKGVAAEVRDAIIGSRKPLTSFVPVLGTFLLLGQLTLESTKLPLSLKVVPRVRERLTRRERRKIRETQIHTHETVSEGLLWGIVRREAHVVLTRSGTRDHTLGEMRRKSSTVYGDLDRAGTLRQPKLTIPDGTTLVGVMHRLTSFTGSELRIAVSSSKELLERVRRMTARLLKRLRRHIR